MDNLYQERKRKTILFISGGLIGLAIFIAIYGVGIINPFSDSLISNGYIEKDIAQHYAGWLLYKNSPWQFPLGVGENIAYPYGNAVTFTDSIPLFAIFFKIFKGVLPRTFQYFGIFVMLCFVLQGAFGALLAGLFNKNTAVDCLCAAILVFSPIMLERAFRHCALTAHFLILAALYFYFSGREKKDFKAYLPFYVLNLLAVMIHPYFMPFTFGIMFAFAIEKIFSEKRITPALHILGSIAATVSVGYIIGIFYVGGSLSSLGYGYFSMNLNALYNPVSRGFDNWSAVLEIKPNQLGQIEGFNYLGLGILIFLPVAAALYILLFKKQIFSACLKFCKEHFGIIFSTAALTVFAIGDWIRFGGLNLFRLPIPESITNGIFGIFRANGRFGNLLVYMTVLFVLFALLKLKKPMLSAVLLALILVVQVYDMRGVLASKHAYFTGGDGDMQSQKASLTISSDFWQDAAQNYDFALYIYSPVNNSCIDIAQIFGRRGKAVNTAFEAKVDYDKYNSLCQKTKEYILNGSLDEDTIVVCPVETQEMADAIRQNGYSVFYTDGITVICKSKFSENDLGKYKNSGDFRILEYPYSIQ